MLKNKYILIAIVVFAAIFALLAGFVWWASRPPEPNEITPRAVDHIVVNYRKKSDAPYSNMRSVKISDRAVVDDLILHLGRHYILHPEVGGCCGSAGAINVLIVLRGDNKYGDNTWILWLLNDREACLMKHAISRYFTMKIKPGLDVKLKQLVEKEAGEEVKIF